jgi:hypothetical protein
MISCSTPVGCYGKISQNVGRQAVDCSLVVLKSDLRQSQRKVQAPNPATPFEQFNTFLCFGLPVSKARCVSFYFQRSCPEQRPRGAGGAA